MGNNWCHFFKFSNNWATYETLFFLVYSFHIRNVYLPLELLSKITCYMNFLRFRPKNLKLTLFELVCLFPCSHSCEHPA